MGCPLCTRWGMILMFSGLGAFLLSNFYSFLFYIGFGLIIAAYIVPFLLPKLSPKASACEASCSVDEKTTE